MPKWRETMNFIYETDRLILQVLNESYSMQVLTFLSRNRDYFDRYELAKTDNFYTEEFQKKLLHKEFNQIIKGSYLRLYFFLKKSPQRIIGTLSFSRLHPAFQSCQIGYKLDPLYQHRGLATEALQFVIPIVSQEYSLHRIEAYVLPSNQPSICLLERLGFEVEGIARDYAIIAGRWQNHLQYSLIL